jgi:2-polyprenyl-3-methyl-5-hydroxy-6-metoxy-1,4-benzoquinol methylase
LPLSNLHHLPAVAYFAMTLRPQRILDIGVGMGTYGFILRQFIDDREQRLEKANWQTVIDGIEIFEAYRNPVWEYVYDRIYIGDAQTLVDRLERYDVVLCNDVLEHLELSEARAFLSKLVEANQTVIATTPNIDFPQGSWAGNEAETHRCFLQAADFPYLVAKKNTGITTCFVCTRREDHRALIERYAPGCPICKRKLFAITAARVKKIVRRTRSAIGIHSS